LNFGVRQLLETLVELAPPPTGRADVDGTVREVTEPFSAVVFKVQAGMDASHRDRLAYMRIVSGEFERGMVVTHAQTGKPFATKYAQAVFGRDRS
ncbi:peptide chain release factor 3, partial [Streptomyces sp. SID10244]|nr:peptide chain release factor 3 [Streptomyces sp. SID10244]